MFLGLMDRTRLRVPTAEEALPGRPGPAFEISGVHAVLGTPLDGPWPDGLRVFVVGMGCFWGAERLFWRIDGVWSTQVGYAGGATPYPTYQEVCSGGTGHTEIVRVVFDPAQVSIEVLLRAFWEEHDPTQGMRQGNDVGTQYRSALYAHSDEDVAILEASREAYQRALTAAGLGTITTEVRRIEPDQVFLAEPYHQQYLHKNPDGYCGLRGTGVGCPGG